MLRLTVKAPLVYNLLILLISLANSQTTHECNRPCVEGGKTKTCRYKFDVQWYLTMSKACYNCPFDQTDCFRRDCVPGKFSGLPRDSHFKFVISTQPL